MLFMRHKLLVRTVKKFLQSVYIYGSYRKIKTGVPFFLDHPVCDGERLLQRASCAVTAVGLQRTKSKMFDDNPYVENTPSPTSVDIKGMSYYFCLDYLTA